MRRPELCRCRRGRHSALAHSTPGLELCPNSTTGESPFCPISASCLLLVLPSRLVKYAQVFLRDFKNFYSGIRQHSTCRFAAGTRIKCQLSIVFVTRETSIRHCCQVVFQVFHSGHFALTMYRKKHPQSGELPSSILNHPELGCVSRFFILRRTHQR
ncbi:hypothetical protein B0H13DRAFT_323791 [Mycena leptocephala]|nr:hypothetical protein B0H13DRAFT_323791 [Mycena leptocephala]